MFIDNRQTQPSVNAQRGQYLQLVMCAENHQDDYSAYRAIVRTVTVVPFGNFSAVSKIVIGARSYRPVYGQTIIVHPDVFELCIEIPAELAIDVTHYQHSAYARKNLSQWARRNVAILAAPIVPTKGKRLRQERQSQMRPVLEPQLPTTCTVCHSITWVMANYCDNCGADLIAQLNVAPTSIEA